MSSTSNHGPVSGEVMETISDRIRQWRIDGGYTLKEVSDALSLSLGKPIGPSAISNYEKRNNPSATVLASLKEAFPEVDLNWILLGAGYPKYGLTEAEQADFYIPEAVEDGLMEVTQKILEFPFTHPDLFLTPEEMTPAERHTYAMTVYAGLRQIARGICRDSRRFGPPKGTKGSKRAFKEAGTHP